MMGERTGVQAALFYEFDLDWHLPGDHLLRAIDRFVDLSGIRPRLRPFYSAIGRPSTDPEQIIGMLREGEVSISQGQTVGMVCKTLSISEQSYYRWRRDYGGLKLDQAKRLKDLERENERLRPSRSPRNRGAFGGSTVLVDP